MPEAFYMPPAPARSLWLIAAALVLIVVPMLLLGYVAVSGRSTRYEISGNGLAIRGTMYGRTIAWEDLNVGEARVVDLATERELQPTLRTNGIGLPGYRAGWFRLRQPGKGLLFVTDRSKVVAIPTRLGYTLILSVSDPHAFLERVRQQAG
jgi:hypothetical protein